MGLQPGAALIWGERPRERDDDDRDRRDFERDRDSHR
jgi:hypothetical protein